MPENIQEIMSFDLSSRAVVHKDNAMPDEGEMKNVDTMEYEDHLIDENMMESDTIFPQAKQECELSARKEATEYTSVFEDSMQKPLKQRILKDAIFRRKFIIWLCLCVVFAILGWNVGVAGPTLLDLQIISQCTLQEAALFVTAMSVGYLLASFVLPLTFNRFDKFLHIAFGNMGLVVIMAATPWGFYYGIMLTMHLLKGFMFGMSELAASTLLIHLMGQDVRVYMQILHFSYTVGGIISPLGAAPFLSQANITDPMSTYTLSNTSSYDHSTTSGSNWSTETYFSMSDVVLQQPLDVYVIYTISSGLNLLPVILSILMFLKCDKKLTQSNKDKDTYKRRDLPRGLLLPVIVELLLISFFCFSVEDTVAAFTATYAVKHFGWTKSLASYVTSVYWTSFSLGSFSGIFIATYFPVSKLLLFYSMMLLLSTICLLVTSIYNIDTGLWVFTAVSGVSVSLNFPLLFAWVEEDFLHVTAGVAAALTMSCGVGLIISPIIVGVIMEISTVYYSVFLFANSVMLFLHLCIGKILSIKAQTFRRRADVLK